MHPEPAEPHAANALQLSGTIIFPASFPRTRARIEARGFHVTSIDISELQKAESGLTCSSLIFANTNSASLSPNSHKILLATYPSLSTAHPFPPTHPSRPLYSPHTSPPS